MKKTVACILTIAILTACKKDPKPADPVGDAFAALGGKYLVCDSVKTTVGGRTTSQVLGKGKGWDLIFGLYGDLQVNSNPVVYRNFSYESPDKIYYWPVNSSYLPNQFYNIISIAGNKLVLKDTDPPSGKVYTEYFTAE